MALLGVAVILVGGGFAGTAWAQLPPCPYAATELDTPVGRKGAQLLFQAFADSRLGRDGSWFTRVRGPGSVTGYIELRDLCWQVNARAVTPVEQAGGLEWDGAASILGRGRVWTPATGWGEWVGPAQVLVLMLTRDDGQWHLSVDETLAAPTSRSTLGEKPTIDEIPPRK